MKKVWQLTVLMGLLVVLLAGCIHIPLGDGNKLKLSKDGLEFTDADGGKHSITLDEDEETVRFQGFGEGEEGESEWTFGTGADVPDDFPKDIPIMKDAMIIQSMNINGEMMVMYMTEEPVEHVSDTFRDYLEQNGESAERSELSYGEEYTAYHHAAEMTYGRLIAEVFPGEEGGTVVIVTVVQQREE